jgi:hypothetical protein
MNLRYVYNWLISRIKPIPKICKDCSYYGIYCSGKFKIK